MANNIRLTASLNDQVTRPVTGIKSKITGLAADAKSSVLTGVGLGAGVTGFNLLGNAVEGATRFVKDSIGAASDLNEEVSKSGVVFGASAAKVQSFASTAAKGIGQSKVEALAAAGAFGNMFRTTGLAEGAAADMSIAMVKLASDMASFNNEDPGEMLDKLRSGLSGEAEPLRRFGVLLSEATVKSFAYANGIAKAGAVLTEAQKVQARYGLILEQTAIQQGDFARTGDSFANTQRKLEAQLENLSATIGQKLLPVVTDLANFISDDVVPAFEAAGPVIDFVADKIGKAVELITFPFRAAADIIGKVTGLFDQASEKATSMSEDWATAWSGMKVTTVAGGRIVVAKTRDAMDDTAKEVGKAPRKMADELRANQFHFQTAVEELRDFMEHTLTPREERMRARAFLASKALADGLKHGNPLVRQKARELKADAEAVLARGSARRAGEHLAKTYAQGIDGAAWNAIQAAARMAAGVAGFLPSSEPKNPRSALRGITTMGGKMVRMIADDMRRNLPAAESAAGSLSGALAMSGGGSAAMGGRGGRGGDHSHDIYIDGRLVMQAVSRQKHYGANRAGFLPRR